MTIVQAAENTTIAIFPSVFPVARARSSTTRITLRPSCASFCIVGVIVRTPTLSSPTSSDRCCNRKTSLSTCPFQVSKGSAKNKHTAGSANKFCSSAVPCYSWSNEAVQQLTVTCRFGLLAYYWALDFFVSVVVRDDYDAS